MLILFIVYGSLILMNVLVTLMVTRTDAEKAEISLITQRIEEISGATDFFASCIFGKKREKFINKVRLGLTLRL